MSDDIKARPLGEYLREQADRIEALETENARLRGAWDDLFDAAQQVHRDGGRQLARMVTERYDEA